MYSLSKYSLSKYLILALLCLLLGSNVLAQSTTVSGQVTDLGGQSWNNGTYMFQFIPNNNFPSSTYSWTGGVLNQIITGSLNGTGGYSQSVPSNTSITPSLSQWRLQVCSGTNPVNCFSVTQTITGGSQTVNVTPLPIVVPPGAGNTAYVTIEVSPAIVGSQIYIIGTGLQVCSTVAGGVCTVWTGASSNSSGLSTIGSTFGDSVTGATLTTSAVRYITIPFACSLQGWHIMADAGTVTIKVARVNGGTALPTVGSNSISTSGVALSTGTKVDSALLTDFTSVLISANDTLGFFITAVATAKQITFQLDCK